MHNSFGSLVSDLTERAPEGRLAAHPTLSQIPVRFDQVGRLACGACVRNKLEEVAAA